MDIQESNGAPEAVEDVASTPATIALLPTEDLRSVFCYVKCSDLFCACVCHYWNHICTPLG